MYLQLNDILLLRKLTSQEVRELKLTERETKSGRAHELTLKTRTEKARNEFMFKTAQVVNRLEKQLDFTKMIGLKKRLLIT